MAAMLLCPLEAAAALPPRLSAGRGLSVAERRVTLAAPGGLRAAVARVADAGVPDPLLPRDTGRETPASTSGEVVALAMMASRVSPGSAWNSSGVIPISANCAADSGQPARAGRASTCRVPGSRDDVAGGWDALPEGTRRGTGGLLLGLLPEVTGPIWCRLMSSANSVVSIARTTSAGGTPAATAKALSSA